MRQQTAEKSLIFNQSEAFLCLGLFDKTNLQIVPENLQVTYKWFTSAFKCSYKCSLSNSNFNSSIFFEFRQ